MEEPLVSVIALSYNHEKFIVSALESIIHQTYSSLEIILVDDASTDKTVKTARTYLKQNKISVSVKTLFLKENVGNCTAFNRGLALARGKYVIDFATDDIMLPRRVEQQVAFFKDLPDEYGVVFSEAEYVDETGNHLWYHYRDRLKHIQPIPTGDVYADVLSRYFISSPTMMVKKEVLDDLRGYDEQLAYEDFDFWVRSARNWKYAYLDECTTQVRKHDKSMSTGWYRPGDPQLYSTYLVCRKAFRLNKTKRERKALILRVLFELKQAIFNKQWREATLLTKLLFTTLKQLT